MKKLSLDLEGLAVESFDTAAPESARRGTVHGNSYGPTDSPTVCNTMCNWSDAPNISCVHTCDTSTAPATEPLDYTCYKGCAISM